HPHSTSFPPRRSSDLLHSQALSAQTELTSLRRNATAPAVLADGRPIGPRNQRQSGHSKMHLNVLFGPHRFIPPLSYLHQAQTQKDRKSTRLNSSHGSI